MIHVLSTRPPSRVSLVRETHALIAKARRDVAVGALITTNADATTAADGLNAAINALDIDAHGTLTTDPQEDWKLGCAIGFDDAYQRGCRGDMSGESPAGSPAYVAAYTASFSKGYGYGLGKSNLTTDMTKSCPAPDSTYVMLDATTCNSQYDAWIAANPQAVPTAAEKSFWADWNAFVGRWQTAYLNTYKLGLFDSADAALKDIANYCATYQEFVKQYQALGGKPPHSYTCPAPPTDWTQYLPWLVAIAGIGAVAWLFSSVRAIA